MAALIGGCGVVTTLAGLAFQQGSANGTGVTAKFNTPRGLAVDASGTLYVADAGNNAIRKITGAPGGAVSTLAGSVGNKGSADATGSGAQFDYPWDVAVDASGNVYVADMGNCAIRKVTPGGVVTNLTGLGYAGSADGTGRAAEFNQPMGVAVDAYGTVYVVDSVNNTIRKVTPGGVVTTWAGSAGHEGSTDGTGSAARFNQPLRVAVDASGTVYVVDSGNHTIRKVTPGGMVSTLAGSAGHEGSKDGTGSAARFTYPGGVAVDASGTVYLADSSNDTIRKIAPGGVVTTWAGSAGHEGSTDGTGSAARFNSPVGVAVDASGNVYVADCYNHTIREYQPSCFPQITTPPVSKTVIVGSSAVFSVAASGSPAPSYQWQVSTAGGNSWSNLSDGGNYSGATTATLTLTGVTEAMNGHAFVCVAVNSFGSFRSAPALLTVNPR